MKITLFKNMKGMIHGADPKRIGCARSGTLKIGKTEVNITSEEDSIMPMLFYGGTGNYDATYTTSDGEVYHIEAIAVRGGWVAPPPHTDVEIMELRCRADIAEEERDAMKERLRELGEIFDTNSLNFLIK